MRSRAGVLGAAQSVFAKNPVKRQMQLVFDMPMPAHQSRCLFGVNFAVANIELLLKTARTRAPNLHDRVDELRPLARVAPAARARQVSPRVEREIFALDRLSALFVELGVPVADGSREELLGERENARIVLFEAADQPAAGFLRGEEGFF